MTVTNTHTKHIYPGDGQRTIWPFTFPLFNAQDLRLWRVGTDGKAEIVSSGFYVDMEEKEVEYPLKEENQPAPATGEYIVLQRVTPLTQEFDAKRQQTLDLQTWEDAHDLAVMREQELAEELSRTLKFPVQTQTADTDAAAYLATITKLKDQAQEVSQEALEASLQANQNAQAAAQTASQAKQQAQEAQESLAVYVSQAQAAKEAAQEAQEQAEDFSSAAQSFAQTCQQEKASVQELAQTVSSQTQQAVNAAQTAQTNAQTAQTNAQNAQSFSQSAQSSAQSASQSAQAAASSASLADIQNKITNCLTKIPQDINLTLENGELKLTNSYIYVPNGPDIFEKVNITTSRNWTVEANKTFLLYLNTKSVLTVSPVEKAFSGDTAPEGATYAFWYDTANNKIKYVANDGVWQELQTCLPVAVVSSDGTGKIARIDQVFNGFGYIGKTLFVLPGVEGLIPNGRKADGSLNNIKFSVNRLLTRTNTSWNILYIDNNGIYSSASRKYNEEQNYNYELTGNTITKQISIGRAFFSNDRITSFNPKFVFHAMEYRESIPFNYLGSITVCEGDSAIAGDYTLPQIAQSGADRLCLFCVHLATTQSGGSSMALSSGVVTTPCEIASANNGHGDGAAFFFPVDKTGKITVSFPGTGGGIGNLTSLKLIGYI